MKTVNETGLMHIRDFLIDRSQYGSAYEIFDKHDLGLRKFASEAEFQMSIGNPPEIELKAYETKSHRVETFEIPKEGIDPNI